MSRRSLPVLLLVLGLLVVVLAIFFLPEDEEQAPTRPSPAEPGAPPSPATDNLHLALGNPSGAVADPNQPTNYLISRDEYALAYQRDLGTPLWASWHLDTSNLGAVERYAGQFIPDNSLPADWYRVRHGDYSGSGYDRGHMVPSADRTDTPAANEATFILTNIVPQAPANNQGPWADLEDYLREVVREGNEAYIVAGPQGAVDTIADGAVTVPEAVWKVAVLLPVGNNDLARITPQTEVIAILMPNDNSVEGRTWDEYQTSVSCIEAVTGLDLLVALPDPVESALSGASCASNGGTQPAPAQPAAGEATIGIAAVEFNPAGEDLLGEYVLLENEGAQAVNLSGWTLEDEAGTIYSFPNFTLAAGGSVRVWVQAGTDDAENLFWGRTQAVWNNNGDVVVLRDATGAEVGRFGYP